ncbi:type II toxin-antitoxin system prevent-host-death family antitoxin [Azospirillum sp.]|uniref:type II toxin-antitoxin system Phd/YefM family antitoxin n=1 Tax=Azospirillum sp. TaxID=34012 RepID=UPI002D6C4566|nr:type II toxin-antitoxin system prevent-host-death family antitoxin [Azospirillum sp.]HYD69997.1 type II toxin-antitoxin system prevent-host-death family antitoxin [Azospirillum sp.]
MGKMVSMDEVAKHLPRLLEQVSRGEEVTIADDGKPVARLVPVATPIADRTPGIAKGEFALTEAFFDPLPEDELKAWES